MLGKLPALAVFLSGFRLTIFAGSSSVICRLNMFDSLFFSFLRRDFSLFPIVPLFHMLSMGRTAEIKKLVAGTAQDCVVKKHVCGGGSDSVGIAPGWHPPPVRALHECVSGPRSSTLPGTAQPPQVQHSPQVQHTLPDAAHPSRCSTVPRCSAPPGGIVDTPAPSSFQLQFFSACGPRGQMSGETGWAACTC